MGLPDIVYLVRQGDGNEELRYSLRSLANVPHRRVWLAGYQPAWTTGVGRISVDQSADRWTNINRNMITAARHEGVSEQFVMFNDDFFVLQPVDRIPVLHRGPFRRVVPSYASRGDGYGLRIRATADHVGMDGLCYDSIHTPLPMTKTGILEMWESMPPLGLLRSCYGNHVGLGGTVHPDVKVRDRKPGRFGAFVSTTDSGFKRGDVGKYIRRRFTEPSPYEV